MKPVTKENGEVLVSRCAIASPHRLATEAGARSYRQGGNAIDAALTAAIALTVVYPHMCAVGGDLWAIVVDPDGRATVVDGSGVAPAGLSADQLRERYGSMPVTGPDTITVPGAVEGWRQIHELGGRLEWADLFEDAIAMATDGVPIASSLALGIAEEARQIESDDGLRALFASDDTLKSAGDPLVQPELARSLEALAAGGSSELYGGELGARLADGLRRLGSPMSLADLAEHTGKLREPLRADIGDLEILTSPPPSQGLALLQAMLSMKDAEAAGQTGIATLAQIFRLVSADRDRFLADPDVVEVPVEEILSPARIAAIVEEATGPGAADAREGERRPRPGGDTSAVTTVDTDGWAVSLIESVFHSFGSGKLEPTTGILCHNRGAGFSLDPSSPNRLAPGKRPMHTLMPVIARGRDGLLASAGTMGGLGHHQILAQVLSGLAEGLPASEMVSRPRFTVGGLDVDSPKSEIFAEDDLGERNLRGLRASGMRVQIVPPNDESQGHAQIATMEGGVGDAAADPRADGSGEIVERKESPS